MASNVETIFRNEKILREKLGKSGVFNEARAIMKGELLLVFIVLWFYMYLSNTCKRGHVEMTRVCDILFIYVVDDLRDTPHCPSSLVLQVGIADNSNFKEFLPVEIRKLPEGMYCSRCLKPVPKSTSVDYEHLCVSCHSGKFFPMAFKIFDPLPFVIPPMISTGVNYIIIVARMSNSFELPGEGYSFLRSFVEVNQ